MEEPLGFEVVGPLVAGVGVMAVAPGEMNKRRIVEGRRKQPTSIIPHTSATAGGSESGAHLLAGFVLAVVRDTLCPADTELCKEEPLQHSFNIRILIVSFAAANLGEIAFCGSVNCQGVASHLSRQADSLVQALEFSQPLGCRVTKIR